MSNKEKHWDKTRGLMMITLAIWFVFGYLIFMFGSSLNSGSFLGYPLAYYMCAQGSIIAFVVLIFWFANRQEKIDEEFGFSEQGEDD
tara:strand:- start:929 stop:1189 length:261 start_codon:yes stop_codon:yes gene_type:complete